MKTFEISTPKFIDKLRYWLKNEIKKKSMNQTIQIISSMGILIIIFLAKGLTKYLNSHHLFIFSNKYIFPYISRPTAQLPEPSREMSSAIQPCYPETDPETP